jgi:hypothetical protein
LGRSCSDDWNAPAKHIARRLYAYTGRPSTGSSTPVLL